jgi:serine/threonine protein kinase
MGFGIASRFPRERQSPELPEFIAGTLAYMAPKQTGRMNRSIDSCRESHRLVAVDERMILREVFPYILELRKLS